MSVISMKQLLEAGVHFGHQTRRWNRRWLNTSSPRETDLYYRPSENSQENRRGLLFRPRRSYGRR